MNMQGICANSSKNMASSINNKISISLFWTPLAGKSATNLQPQSPANMATSTAYAENTGQKNAALRSRENGMQVKTPMAK